MPAVDANRTQLRALLDAEGRRQRWLAEATGIPYGAMVRIVSGARVPNVLEVQSIAHALGRDVSVIAELWELDPAEAA